MPGVERTGTADAERDEVVALLADLLRADTSNPPGDARPAAAVLARYFRENGLGPVVLGEADDLPNVVVRLEGAGGGPSLLMLGHLDVVPADAREWSTPPFSGTVKEGAVWGRGALDMKNQLATQALALVRLARRARAGLPLRGDLIYAATADEETGIRCGASWLSRERPDLVRADFCINEGGLDMFERPQGRLYTVHVGEKGYANCRITLTGRPGHASVPRRDTALERLAEAVRAVQAYRPEVHEEFLPADFIRHAVEDEALRSRLADPATAQAAVRELAHTDPGAAAVIEPLLGLTFSPTMVSAGDAVNVIPSTAELVVDCRTLPGQTLDDVHRELEQALAGLDRDTWTLEFFGDKPGSASPARSALREAIVESLRELVPDAVVVETLFSGFTDCVHVREAFPGTVAYGFCPFIEETGDLVRPRLHGIDERITVRDLRFQAEFAERLALRLLG